MRAEWVALLSRRLELLRGPRLRGVQAEVLASLSVVMLTATALLAVVLLKTHSDHLSMMRDFVALGLLERTRSPTFAYRREVAGIRWWVVSPATGQVRALPGSAEGALLEAAELELAVLASQRGGAVMVSGPPWQPIRFAAPMLDASGGMLDDQVAVARIAPAVSPFAVVGLLFFDSAVFSLLGAHLLRRRVVQPLRRLRDAAGRLAEGGLAARAPVEGVGEVADLARTFNDVSEALERRTGALEKAVHELRQANSQLLQARAGLDRAERMAAVGRLAAGVAHEVGNPMGAILAFLDLARRDASLSPAGARHLERAAEQGERVRQILRQLLDFSRPPRATHTSFDLHRTAEKVVGLVSAQQRYSRIRISLRSEDGVGLVRADESLVSQILLNLLLNAADAVSDANEPRITLTLRPNVLRRRGSDPDGTAARGDHDAVECTVCDNGVGIAEEDRDRIFDPFFTTKPPGEGTGLGLANAAQLVEELGGQLELVHSGPGEQESAAGTCFRLCLAADQMPCQQSSHGVRG